MTLAHTTSAVPVPDQAALLVRRFVALAPERRRLFLAKLTEQGIDFSQLPIPHGLADSERAPLSHTQQALWFLAQLAPDSAAYHIAGGLRLRGPMDREALQQAFDTLAERHTALRTTFHAEDGQPFQRIHPPRPVAIRYLLVGANEFAPADDARQPFNLEHGPLWRITLARLGAEDHGLWLTLHHLIADGWSLNHLLDEFAELYSAAVAGRAAHLPVPPIRYADYALWQRAWLDAGEMDRQLAYWTTQLGDEHPVLELPSDRPRPEIPSYRGGRVAFRLDPALSLNLAHFARREGATVFMVLLAGFKALLYRYSGQRDMRVGVPVAQRDRTDTAALVGYFVNTLVFRTELAGNLDFRALLTRIKATVQGAQAHPDLPFERLVEALHPERHLGHNPLFQVLYNHQRRDLASLAERTGWRVERLDPDNGAAQFDLSLDTEEDGEGLISGVFTYAADLFAPATITRLSAHFVGLLRDWLAEPTRPLAALPMLDEAEQRHIAAWNTQTQTWPRIPVHDLIRHQAEIRPQAPALIFEPHTLSYGELECRANRLAHRLLRLGASPDVPVGVIVERSAAMVVAMLAVLKAGAAYLPLDPEAPPERLTLALNDAGASLLLTDTQDRFTPPEGVLAVLLSDDAEQPDTPPAIPVHPEQLAYLIYTSGSTGQPKGVAVAHGPLSMHCQAIAERYRMSSADCALHFATLSFDAAVEQWIAPLISGASLLIRGPELWSAEQAYAALTTHGVTWFEMPPAYLAEIARWASEQGKTLPLRACSVGGEAVTRESLDVMRRLVGNAPIINGYGPTETVITPLVWTADADTPCPTAYAPIGTPVGERTAYILDGDLNPVPVGVAGELYIGGAGLARGYQGRPDLTAERFIPNPFVRLEAGGMRLEEDGFTLKPQVSRLRSQASSLKPQNLRLYRTGDRARWLADGTVEYLGRTDHQIKLRGYRIELGEIEAQLLAHPAVTEAVVLVHGEGAARKLVAYLAVSPASGLQPQASPPTASSLQPTASLQAHLRQHLPDYMVPTRIVTLDRLPKLPSGKLDRKALPDPEWTGDSEFHAPHTAAEQTLAAIWQEVLGRERVGRHDNFFELGGDSIISLRVVSRARQAGWRIAPRDIFQHQTVAGLARVAARLDSEDSKPEPVVASGDAVGLSPMQAAFFEEEIPDRQHWNLSLMLETRQPLDLTKLQTALRYLIGYHDALRLRYRQANGAWSAHLVGCAEARSASVANDALPTSAHPTEWLWVRAAADAQALERIAQEAQRSLNLETGPLLRVVYIEGLRLEAEGRRLEENALAYGLKPTASSPKPRLLLVIHHLVVDGVSWRVILEDLCNIYQQLGSGGRGEFIRPQGWGDGANKFAPTEIVLPEPTTPFSAWTAQLRDHIPAALSELPYWESQCHAAADLPRDWPTATGCFRDAETVTLRLGTEPTRALLQDAPTAYRARINDLLLTALARTLCRWSGHESVLIELESHGRDDIFDGIDISRTVGWFTATYPLRLTPAQDLGAALKAVKEQLRHVPGGGLGYGVLRYLAAPEIQARLRALPRPRVVFNYLGRFDTETGALFQPAPESAGDDHSPNAPLAAWLDINGQVYGGELELRWRFSRAMYRAETIQHLVDDYRRELLDLIEHCLSGTRGATPSDFPLAGLDQARLDALYSPEIEDLYPLSPLQQGLLFHARYAPDTDAYVNQLAVDIEGLDETRFAEAWRAIARRHAILRTAFPPQHDGETPLQAVYRQAEPPLVILDGRNMTAEQLTELRHRDHAQGFDLSQPPLMRLTLVRLDNSRHHLLWTSHHLLLDGWSTSRLLGELLDIYHGGNRFPAASYRDYIAWLQRRDPTASANFWREPPVPLEQPTLLADALPAASGQGWGLLSYRLEAAASHALHECAKQQRITLNTLIQGAWVLLLQRYTGQQTVVFGTTVAGRPAEIAGVEDILGLFINTLPLVQAPGPERPAADWLRELQNYNLALREHEHTPLYEIQRAWGYGGQTLFDTLLVFENYPVDQALREAGGAVRFSAPVHVDTTHYPLTLNVSLGETLGLAFGYDRAKFDAARMARLSRHFERLLTALVAEPIQSLGRLGLLGADEMQQIATWNATARHYPDQGLIHERIRRHAERQPDAPALIFGEHTLSYGELDRRADRLAQQLIRRGVGPDVPVGIQMYRSLEMVVGLFAILKAGGAYVPLDPDYPAERLAYMLEDSGVGIRLEAGGWRLEGNRLEEDGFAIVPQVSSPKPQASGLQPQNLAYIIYTSGSTGRPKGAGNTHAALLNRLDWMQAAYPLGPDDTVLQKTPFGFDVSVWEFFWPLMVGARLAIAPPGAHRDPGQLVELIRAHRVTTVHFVPSMLQEFLAHPAADTCTGLKRMICSGEALALDTQQRVFERLPGVALYNLYGPTEAAIDVTHWTCVDDGTGSVPIGQPIANVNIHILDAQLNPVPVGVAGELYIGGAGLARGYHQRPSLTAERFIPNPFFRLEESRLEAGGWRLEENALGSDLKPQASSLKPQASGLQPQAPNLTLYRTGDLARRREDGVIEYLGRLDHQVKLRGVRIELGEIEAALLEQAQVREAAVLLRDSGTGPQLVGYVATDTDPELPDRLKIALRARLPDAMVPSRILCLDRLPKTPNGKLDRKALPAPDWQARAYQAPHTATEHALAAMWREILGVEQVGANDDFFDLGGHSLLAMKLVGRIRQGLNLDVPVRVVFERPGLADLARAIEEQQAAAHPLEHALSAALAELNGLSAAELQALLSGNLDL